MQLTLCLLILEIIHYMQYYTFLKQNKKLQSFCIVKWIESLFKETFLSQIIYNYLRKQ